MNLEAMSDEALEEAFQETSLEVTYTLLHLKAVERQQASLFTEQIRRRGVVAQLDKAVACEASDPGSSPGDPTTCTPGD